MVIFALFEPAFAWLLSRAGTFAFSAGRSRVVGETEARRPDPGDDATVLTGGGVRIMQMIQEQAIETPARRKFQPIIDALSPPKRIFTRTRIAPDKGAIGKAVVGAALVPMWARDP